LSMKGPVYGVLSPVKSLWLKDLPCNCNSGSSPLGCSWANRGDSCHPDLYSPGPE
jgi:hypothetical protein